MLSFLIFLLFSNNVFSSDFATFKEKLFPLILKSYISKPKKSKKTDKKLELTYSSDDYYTGIKYSGAIALGMFYEKNKDIYKDRVLLLEKYIKYAFPVTKPQEDELDLLKKAVRYGQLIYKYKTNKIYVKKSEKVLNKIDKIEDFPVQQAQQTEVQKDCTEKCLEKITTILSNDQTKNDKKIQTMAEVRGMESDALSRLTESSVPEISKELLAIIEPVLDICKNYIEEEDPFVDFFNFLTDVSEVKKIEQERDYCINLFSLWVGEENITDKEQRQKAEMDLLKISLQANSGAELKKI